MSVRKIIGFVANTEPSEVERRTQEKQKRLNVFFYKPWRLKKTFNP